jgi:hypothetical protein
MIPNIKCYIPNSIPSKLVLPEPTIVFVAIDHQMAVIQVQLGNNFFLNVLLNGGSRVNIIMEKMRVQLGLSKPKPTPCNPSMANQTIAKPIGLIKDLKILVHGIPYVVVSL